MKTIALLSAISLVLPLLVITGFFQVSDAAVNGCYNSRDGTFRILISGQCKKGETPVSLYEKGDVDDLVSGLQSSLSNLQTQLSSYQEVKDLLCDYAISSGLPECPGFCTCPKSVFVTSWYYTADLGGLSGADAKCQARASAGGLPGTYKAWLSDSTASPSTRFSKSPSSYVLVNGTVVANSWSDLTDGALLSPINIDEYGHTVTGYPLLVYTHTATDGSISPSNMGSGDCNEWTTGEDVGGLGGGLYTVSDFRWTAIPYDIYMPCDGWGRLYCFQQ